MNLNGYKMDFDGYELIFKGFWMDLWWEWVLNGFERNGVDLNRFSMDVNGFEYILKWFWNDCMEMDFEWRWMDFQGFEKMPNGFE